LAEAAFSSAWARRFIDPIIDLTIDLVIDLAIDPRIDLRQNFIAISKYTLTLYRAIMFILLE
jgi:hypothetical protein